MQKTKDTLYLWQSLILPLNAKKNLLEDLCLLHLRRLRNLFPCVQVALAVYFSVAVVSAAFKIKYGRICILKELFFISISFQIIRS